MDIKEMMNSISKSSCFGNTQGGRDFDDVTVCSEKGFPFPAKIIVRTGSIVDNVTFDYGQFIQFHGGRGGRENKFVLEKGEHIVQVSGKYTTFNKAVVISSIEFRTDKGRCFVPVTSTNVGTSFSFTADDGYAICGLYGTSDAYVNSIGFYTRKIDLDLGMPDLLSRFK